LPKRKIWRLCLQLQKVNGLEEVNGMVRRFYPVGRLGL
jgi:hypothetical protein